MLRLVHPAPEGQVLTRKKFSRPESRSPNSEEQARIHAAIKNLIRAYGGRDVLASILGVNPGTLTGRHKRSYSFAYLLARAANIPVEQVLSGKPHEAGACPLCHRKGAR